MESRIVFTLIGIIFASTLSFQSQAGQQVGIEKSNNNITSGTPQKETITDHSMNIDVKSTPGEIQFDSFSKRVTIKQLPRLQILPEQVSETSI